MRAGGHPPLGVKKKVIFDPFNLLDGFEQVFCLKQ